MKYRDDRDALRHRAEGLERALHETEARLRDAEQKAAHHEQKDIEDEKNLAALRAEVAELRGRLGVQTAGTPPTLKASLVIAAAAVSLVAMGAGIFFILRSDAEPPAPVAPIPAQPPPAPTAPKPPAPTDLAIFGAEVIEEQGGRVALGEGCLLRAGIAANDTVAGLTVRCGDKLVYSSSEPSGTGMNIRESGVREFATSTPGAVVYVMRYIDRGERSGPRPEIEVETSRHRARIYREGIEAWSVLLHVSVESFPRWKATQRPRPEITRNLHAVATVTEKSGALELGAKPCELRVHPAIPEGAEHNCRIVLHCGATILYGAESSGYNACTIEDGNVTGAEDQQRTAQDTDPAMKFSWRDRRIEVEDADWRAVFRLEERCRLEGSFAGVSIDATGAERPLSIDAPPKLDCATGLVESGGARYEIQIGPGWRTFGGRIASTSTIVAAMAKLR